MAFWVLMIFATSDNGALNLYFQVYIAMFLFLYSLKTGISRLKGMNT